MDMSTGKRSRKQTEEQKQKRRDEKEERMQQTHNALKEYYLSQTPGYTGEPVTHLTLHDKYPLVMRQTIKRLVVIGNFFCVSTRSILTTITFFVQKDTRERKRRKELFGTLRESRS